MNFLKKLFKNTETKNLMDEAPYLAPWYIQKDKPKIFKDGTQLKFKSESETTLLIDDNGNCYGIIDIYSYILPSDDYKSFLIWSRDLEKVIGLQTIIIKYYDNDTLQAFDDKTRAISNLKNKKLPFSFAVKPTQEFNFKFNTNDTEMKIEFPKEFNKFKQFLLITEMENLYYNPNPDNYWHNTTILDLDIEKGKINNYPQDWFNKSGADFGYEWITRATRNSETNLIHGQGIRISDFILDKTDKQIKSQIKSQIKN